MSREIEQTIKAFRKARREGAELLSQGKINFDQYAFVMIGFEAQLKNLGVDF